MSKYIVLTDSHIKEDNIEIIDNCFNQVIKYCQENNINTIFHLGDWFTNRKAQPLSVLKATQYIIEKLHKAQIITYIIKGNHDATDLESEHSYLDIFNNDKLGFHVIKKESSFVMRDINFCFLPYFKENGSYLERLKNIKLDKKKKNILLTHTSISGVRNNDGSEVKNEVGQNLFNKYFKVFTGHYHQKSVIGNGIYYIGSLCQSSYGEDDNKGFIVLDENGDHEEIITKFPKYIKVEISVDELNLKLINELEKERVETGDDIRLIIKGEKSKIQSIKKSLFSDTGLSIKTEINEIQEQILKAETQDSVVSFDSGKIKDYFKVFCEENKFNELEGNKYLQVI